MSIISNLIGLKFLTELKPGAFFTIIAMIYIGFLISDSPILLTLYILGCLAFVLGVLILPDYWHKKEMAEFRKPTRTNESMPEEKRTTKTEPSRNPYE